MAKSVKKSSQSVAAPHKKQKTKEKRGVDSRVLSTQQVNKSLQARVVKRTEQRDEAYRKLSQTRSTFDTLFQANPIPTALTRLTDQTFMNANVAFLKYFDFKLEEVIGHTLQDLKLGIELQPHERLSLIDRLRTEGGIRNFERELKLPSGKNVTILASLQYLCIDDTEAILSAFIDITEQKQAEEMLRSLVDAAPDATVVVHEDGHIVLVNKQLESTFGYTRQDLLGKPLSMLIPEQFHELHPQPGTPLFQEAAGRPAGAGLKLFARRWDGREFPVEISLSPLKTTEGMLAIAAIRDVTKRVEAERRIRRLATLLSQAEQTERQRISQVLHDDLQQRLFAVKVQLTMLQDAYSQGNWDALSTALTEMEEELQASISITRNLSVEFSPIALQEEDLAGALTLLSTQMQKQYALNVVLNANDIKTSFDNRLSGLLYQVVRELLFNVVKHAETLQATITLEQADDQIRITVSDQGKGFDPTAVLADPGIVHGLLNVRQRLDLIGCQMEITSQPGAGTRVVIHCPNSS